MENFVIYYLLFTIDYFSVASGLSVAQTTVLIGVNPWLLTNSWCLFVWIRGYIKVNPGLFEKTKPICGRAKLAQSLRLKGIMEIFMLWDSEKTKPIQSQFGCFTAENAEGAEVFYV